MYPRWLWPAFAIPGVVWLLILFLLPFYAVIGVAFGNIDPILQTPIPAWNPLNWNTRWVAHVLDVLNHMGLLAQPINSLAATRFTVISAPTSGYLPYFTLPLYASLDRIGRSRLEAARDLGASPFRAFWRVTLPLSKTGLLGGAVL